MGEEVAHRIRVVGGRFVGYEQEMVIGEELEEVIEVPEVLGARGVGEDLVEPSPVHTSTVPKSQRATERPGEATRVCWPTTW